jgi:hypothetical protein
MCKTNPVKSMAWQAFHFITCNVIKFVNSGPVQMKGNLLQERFRYDLCPFCRVCLSTLSSLCYTAQALQHYNIVGGCRRAVSVKAGTYIYTSRLPTVLRALAEVGDSHNLCSSHTRHKWLLHEEGVVRSFYSLKTRLQLKLTNRVANSVF